MDVKLHIIWMNRISKTYIKAVKCFYICSISTKVNPSFQHTSKVYGYFCPYRLTKSSQCTLVRSDEVYSKSQEKL